MPPLMGFVLITSFTAALLSGIVIFRAAARTDEVADRLAGIARRPMPDNADRTLVKVVGTVVPIENIASPLTLTSCVA